MAVELRGDREQLLFIDALWDPEFAPFLLVGEFLFKFWSPYSPLLALSPFSSIHFQSDFIDVVVVVCVCRQSASTGFERYRLRRSRARALPAV